MNYTRAGMRFGLGSGPMPRVIKALLIVNTGLFLLTWLAGWNQNFMTQNFGLVPAEVFMGGKVWQLLTYMFLHGGPFHILFNMFMLWMFGSAVEAEWGDRAFLTYYLVCGVGGGITTWITGPNSMVPTIGASGAVLGVVLAYGLMYPDRQILLYFLFPIKMKYFIWVIVALDLFSGLNRSQDGIGHFAHLGGMLFGYLYLKQDWRLDAWRRRIQGERARRQMRGYKKQQEQQADGTLSVDQILDKITEHGIESLTEQELKVLREARRN